MMTTTAEPATAPAEEAAPASPDEVRIPLFGARAKARALAVELAALRTQTAALGTLSVAELQARRDELEREVAEQTERLASERDEAVADLERKAAEHRDGLLAAEHKAEKERGELEARLSELRDEVTVTEETAPRLFTLVECPKLRPAPASVLDASALIAHLNAEPGAQDVRAPMDARDPISVVNLA